MQSVALQTLRYVVGVSGLAKSDEVWHQLELTSVIIFCGSKWTQCEDLNLDESNVELGLQVKELLE